MRTYSDIGIQAGEILLPRPGIDLKKWAVIACDQFTSEPDYWHKVEEIVGGAPSTYNLILPEVYLDTPGEAERIQNTQAAMRTYLEQNLFQTHEGFILVERQTTGRVRRGLMLVLDLECYDFGKGSHTLIRASEGTILERIPPRVRIRENALLELPHILVLIDDPQRTVIEPLIEEKTHLSPLYTTDLMLGSGHVNAFAVDSAGEGQIVAALRALAEPAAFHSRYGVSAAENVLLFAMGDGNHSLATAKTIWEKVKSSVGPNHPARYALVEIENVHDEGLIFEPIHRVVFGVQEDLRSALVRMDVRVSLTACESEKLIQQVEHLNGKKQAVGLVTPQGCQTLTFEQPSSNLAVGTLQAFLDAWMKEGKAAKIDYVHGSDVTLRLGSQPGNLGFILPTMAKGDLFKTVILDGALPRKTFSMGEAIEKRFYLEARRIA
jgi:hypothetical protein